MTFAHPSRVIPLLSLLLSSRTPPSPDVFPQMILLFHQLRTWFDTVLSNAEDKIQQKRQQIETRTVKGKGKARQEAEDKLELASLVHLTDQLAKGRKLQGKGSNLELIIKTEHIRWILFNLPHDLTSVQLLIDTYFPRPPLSTAAQVSTSALSPDELKKHATQRAIISAVFTFVKNFVASYEGPPDALPNFLLEAFVKDTTPVPKRKNVPWEKWSGWAGANWVTPVEKIWRALEDGLNGRSEKTGLVASTGTAKGGGEAKPEQQQQAPSSSSRPRPPSSTINHKTKRPSTTSTTPVSPPKKKAKRKANKLAGRSMRDMFGGGDDSSSEDEQ